MFLKIPYQIDILLRNTQPTTLSKGLPLGDWGHFIGSHKNWEYMGVYVHISLLWSSVSSRLSSHPSLQGFF